MADLKVKIVVDGKEEYISVEKLALSLSKVGKAGAESASGINKSKRETDSYKKALKELQEPMEKVEKTFKTISKATGAAFAIGAVMSFKAGIDALRESQLKYNNSALATVNRYDQAVESIKSAIANTKIWQSVMESVAGVAAIIEMRMGGASGGLLGELKNKKTSLEQELKTEPSAIDVMALALPRSIYTPRTKDVVNKELESVNAEISRVEAQLAAQAKSDTEFLKTIASKKASDYKSEMEITNTITRVTQIKAMSSPLSDVNERAKALLKTLNEILNPPEKIKTVDKSFYMRREYFKEWGDAVKKQELEVKKMREETRKSRAQLDTSSIVSASSTIGYGNAISMILNNDQLTEEEKDKAIDAINEIWDTYDERQKESFEKAEEKQKKDREIINDRIEKFGSFANIIGDALTGHAKKFKKEMKDAGRAFASELIATGILSALSKALGGGGGVGLFGQLFDGFRANGGDVQAGRAYIVGEKRPELFVPKTNGTIIPDGLSSNAFDPAKFNSSLYNNRPIQVENKITVELDSQQIDAGIKTNGARLNARRGLVGA